MPHFIKTGFWALEQKGYKGWLNLNDIIGNGGQRSLVGTNYVFVSANGTESENGLELIAAYNTAKTMNPSSENRITVLAAPGYYRLPTNLELDTEYIDLVSLDGNRSIIVSGSAQSSNIYYFSDSASSSIEYSNYSINDGGDDMYDNGNFIYVDGNPIAYTHTQMSTDFSGGMPLTNSAIDTFTYVASGTGLVDSYYSYIYPSTTSGNGSDAQFDIVVSGGVVTSVVISENGKRIGRDYALNDTITILGGQIGGVDGVDDLIITVTSLKGYFDVNTSSVASSTAAAINSFTYTATGTTAGDNIWTYVTGTTSGSGKYATFTIEVVAGAVNSIYVEKVGTLYNVNDTITILGSQIGGVDGVDDVVITVTDVFNQFGSSASYFTNFYPGFFFMGAENTEVDRFLIDGGLGADGNGFLDYYTFSQGGYQVYVKRVGGTSDPSVNHIIITNPIDASSISQTVSSNTNDDDHELTGLSGAGVTEIYYLLFAKSNGVTLSNTEVSNIVSQFLTIKNSSATINDLLTNLNTNYSNLTQQIIPGLVGSTISVTANDVFIKGVDLLTKNFIISSVSPLLKIENSQGGLYAYNVSSSYYANDSNFIGRNAGYGARGAVNSNFFGKNAGQGASNAYYSNFLGLNTGYNATNAFNSNFIGKDAGNQATSAHYSNFIGTGAGNRASNAYSSNFIGPNAGNQAIGAYQSNFLGDAAGSQAVDAYYSNFFGAAAGVQANNASNSNFLGLFAGSSATNASNSNFFGNSAGYQATNANESNFFGSSAGGEATDANNSNFLGANAGFDATNASYSNFIGNSSGYQATNASTSNFLGLQAGQNATSANNSNFLGNLAGRDATSANNSNFLGEQAGDNATDASYSNFFGSAAGFEAANAYESNFLGKGSGNGATNAFLSNFLGTSAGQGATNANRSNFIGENAGYEATDASYSNFFGSGAGYQATNAQSSEFIGHNAGYQANNAGSSSFIGTQSGFQASNANNSNFIGSHAGYEATDAYQSNFFGWNAGNNATNANDSNFFGYNTGQNSTGNNVNAFGANAGNGNALNGQTIFSNASMPSFADHTAAAAAITVALGASAGSTYLYHNQATDSIGAVRL